ncbi:MAG: hypothetical protein E2O93_02405 [Alphaproteobacteria bacterium]|nr:MAG: hypothetical protein E2O93_02405 [Alphaproteobacteria bacterium]
MELPSLAVARWRPYLPYMFGKKKKKEADSGEEPEAEAKEAEAAEEAPLDPTTLAFNALRRSQRRFGVMLLVLVLLLALSGSAGEIYMLRADLGAMTLRLDKAVSGMKDSLARIQDQTAATRVGIDVVRKDQAHLKAQMRHISRFLKPKAAARKQKEKPTNG